MIKFLLGFVAIIVVLLVAYMFTNKPTETVKKETISKVKKQDVSKTEIEVSKVPEVKTSKKVLSVAKPSKDVKKKISEVGETETSTSIDGGDQDSVADFSKIGEGLTLEGIKNSDASEDEKDLMLDDLAAYQSYRGRNNPSISKEEGIKALTNSFKKGKLWKKY